MTYFLNIPHCIANMATLIRATLDRAPDRADLPGQYVDALIHRQGLALHRGANWRLWYYASEPDAPSVIPAGQEPFATGYGVVRALTDDEQRTTADLVTAGATTLHTLEPRLHDLVSLLVTDIVLARGERAGTLTTSRLLGVVSFLPGVQWHQWDYAERLLHEAVHLHLYLGDLVHTLFDTAHPDFAKVRSLSAIRVGEARPLVGAFHSACVALAMAYYWHRVGDRERADSFQVRCRDATVGLSEHRQLLSPYGEAIWTQLDEHTRSGDIRALGATLSDVDLARFPAG